MGFALSPAITQIYLIFRNEQDLFDDPCRFNFCQPFLHRSGRNSEGGQCVQVGGGSQSHPLINKGALYQAVQKQRLQLCYLCPRRGYPGHRLKFKMEICFLFDIV